MALRTSNGSNYTIIQDWSDRPTRLFRQYVQIWCPEHPAANSGWVFLHKLVMERTMGRLLQPGETVHHICDKRDNRPEALIVCRETEHVKAHL